jgi:hypothetical protein
MYSEIVNESGISQHTMEIIVLGGFGIFVLGLVFFLWWKQIMIGALALGAVVVLANHRPKTPIVPKVEQEQIIIEKIVVPENPIHIELDEKKSEPPVDLTTKQEVVKPDDHRKSFIEDCLNYSDYSKQQCEKIWDKDDVTEPELLQMQKTHFKRS